MNRLLILLAVLCAACNSLYLGEPAAQASAQGQCARIPDPAAMNDCLRRVDRDFKESRREREGRN